MVDGTEDDTGDIPDPQARELALPIILRTPILSFIISAVLSGIAILYYLIVSEVRGLFWYFVVLILASCVIYNCLRLLPWTNGLSIWDIGINERRLFGELHLPWSEIDTIELVKMGGRQRIKIHTKNPIPTSTVPKDQFLLIGNYGLPAQNLHDLIEAAWKQQSGVRAESGQAAGYVHGSRSTTWTVLVLLLLVFLPVTGLGVFLYLEDGFTPFNKSCDRVFTDLNGKKLPSRLSSQGISHCAKVIESDPGNIRARAVLGYDYARKREYENAYALLNGLENSEARQIHTRVVNGARVRGRQALEEKNFQEAAAVLSFAVKLGSPHATFILGVLYMDHRTGYTNYPAGVQMLEYALRHPQVPARYKAIAARNLGIANEWGLGMEKNIPKAIDFYSKGIVFGETRVYLDLGRVYEEQPPPIRNLELAVSNYRTAADFGQPEAMFRLGRLYLTGKGVPRDPKQACPLIAKAAGMNYQKAADLLAAEKICAREN